MRAVAVGLFLGIVLVVAAASAAPEPEKAAPKPPTVRYRNDKVSVDLHDAPVEAVLQALAKESGAELVGSTRAEQPLTMSFEDVPVKEALERLVGAQNFTLKYDESGKLRAIELRGGPETAKRPKPGEPIKSESENTTPAKHYAFYKAFDRHDTIPLSGDLKKALGKDEAGWDYLGNTAIANQDPRIRQAAMHALVKALDQDPEMKDAVLASLNAMSAEELAAFARQNGHYRAEDLVRNMMRETQDQELRSRARDVLRELKKTPFKGPRVPMH